MKKYLALSVVLFVSIPGLAKVICNTNLTESTEQNPRFSVELSVVTNLILRDISVSLLNRTTGRYHYVARQSQITADGNYHPRNPRAGLFSRFSFSSDGRDVYQLMMPKEVARLERFDGFLRVSSRGGQGPFSTRNLECFQVWHR